MTRIDPVDANDDRAVAEWYEAFRAGIEHGREDPPTPTLPEILVELRRDGAERSEAFVATGPDGRAVGGGMVGFPQLDNPRLAELDVAVRPEHRRAGVGTQLLGYAEERARQDDRTNLLTEVNIARGEEPRTSAGALFADRFGYTVRNVEIRRTLDLPMPAELLDRLRSHAAARSAAYELRSWVGACPEEYAEQYAELKGRLSVDAPLGEMDYEGETWDVDRLREVEDLSAQQGRTRYTAVAVAADGTLVGHTQLLVSSTDPGRCMQGDTLVLIAHRGHRLGLALKVANVEAMAAKQPEVDRVITWNAQQNGPMVGVNEAMGYRVVEHVQARQRDLDRA